MIILANGNVGIGTTTPAAKLTVYGNGTLAANFDNGKVRLNDLGGGGDRCLYVDTNGDIQPAGGACGTASSTGITNLNTLTASTQTFATGTGGTDFNIVSGVSTHTFNIPDAGSGARGLVTTSAQTFGGAKTFNNNVITNAQFLGTSTDTISNPSFSWNGETNTGIYHPAVSQIALTLGGTRRALFTATGLTFTGQTSLTASSLNTLTTASSVSWAGATTLTFTADNATINGSDVANGNLTLQGTSNGTKTTSYLLLQPTGGLVGIGTTTPAQKLDVYGGNIFINDAVITSDTPKAAITKEYFDSALNAYWGLSGSNLYAAATTYNVGIGTTNPLARLQVTGGLILNHTGVADANYTASTTDYIIAYTSLTTNRTVTLPNSLCTPGRFFVVLDESGNASASKKITIDPEGATTVIGQATFSLQAPYNSVYVFCGNSAWFVL